MKNSDLHQSYPLSVYNSVCRSLCKFLYKYTHPKSYKHNRYYWPFYRVERNTYHGIHKIYFKKHLIADNSEFTPAQNKCMLIATGPSVKDIPLDTFNQEDIDYLGVNGAIALDGVHFKYYVIIDHNFIDKRFDLVTKVLKSNCTFFTTPRCLDLILRKFSPDAICCTIKVVELITRGEISSFLGEHTRAELNPQQYFIEDQKGFSKQIQNALFDYFTVAYVALQIIYALGSKEIYLAGLDMNNFNQPRFYEKNENKQPTVLDLHFEEILQSFQVAAKFLKNEDIQVFNLSPNSAVTAFQKIDPITLTSRSTP